MDLADRKIDYIIGGDIVFDFENFDGLFNLLDQLFLKCGTKKAFIGFTHRFSDVEKWFREGLMKHGFHVDDA